MQGALLSLFIPQPIKFRTFTITSNTPFSKESLERSFFLRLNQPNNKLIIQQSKLDFLYSKSETKKPSPNSIIYYKTSANTFHHEVAVGGKKLGLTKKQRLNSKIRLSISKIEMFHCFIKLAKRFKIREGVEKFCYKEAKLMACDYQKVWEKLKCDGFKNWTNKDTGLLDFYLD